MNPTDHPVRDLLPELYSEDESLQVLSEVLERAHLNLERFIERIPARLYDPQRTPDAFLPRLCAALGMEGIGALFTPVQLRALLPDAFWLHRYKGTRFALEYLLYVWLRELFSQPVRFWLSEPGDRCGEPCDEACLYVRLLPPRPLTHEQRRLLTLLVQDYTPVGLPVKIDCAPCASLGAACLGYLHLGKRQEEGRETNA